VQIEFEIRALAKRLLFKKKQITVVPVSGWTGDNLTTLSTNSPWYRGPTLIEAILSCEAPERALDDIVRISTFQIHGRFHQRGRPVGD
jgi:elongation factor 1-alpha